MTRLLVTGLVALVLALIPATAVAQITVQVVDGPSGRPIPLAAVQGFDTDGDLVETQSTGPSGLARLLSVERTRVVRVHALGYRTTDLILDGLTDVTVSLEPTAIELDSLEVEVERRGLRPGRLIWSQRREEHEGIFLDPVDIALKTKYGIHMAFRDLDGIRRTNFNRLGIPRIVSNRGSGCLRYQLNAFRRSLPSLNSWPLSSLLPQDVVAMEIYPSFGEVPDELRGLAAPANGRACGLVVVWTTEAW